MGYREPGIDKGPDLETDVRVLGVSGVTALGTISVISAEAAQKDLMRALAHPALLSAIFMPREVDVPRSEHSY